MSISLFNTPHGEVGHEHAPVPPPEPKRVNVKYGDNSWSLAYETPGSIVNIEDENYTAQSSPLQPNWDHRIITFGNLARGADPKPEPLWRAVSVPTIGKGGQEERTYYYFYGDKMLVTSGDGSKPRVFNIGKNAPDSLVLGEGLLIAGVRNRLGVPLRTPPIARVDLHVWDKNGITLDKPKDYIKGTRHVPGDSPLMKAYDLFTKP